MEFVMCLFLNGLKTSSFILQTIVFYFERVDGDFHS